ncbi:MAG: hypothetical protein CR966_00655, partial [Pseudomonadales bacterium]
MSQQTNPPLTPEMQQQLEQLRDIHLPEPVGWFPPAIGWWVLMGLLVLVVIWVVRRWLSKRETNGHGKRHKKAVLKSAMTEFDGLYAEYLRQQDSAHFTEQAFTEQFAGKLSALIKRVAMYQHESVATLSGAEWADYLQQTGLEREQAEWIAFAPYA